jgi:hypothetical protein
VTAAAWDRARAADAAASRELERVPSWLWDGASAPVPVEALADSHYGLLVEEASDLRARAGLNESAHLSGLLLPAEKLILVDRDEAARAPGRRRFTITHELGHWVLHCSAASRAPVYCRDTTVRESDPAATPSPADPATQLDYSTSELEANQFAAALLMPRDLLLAEPRPSSTDEEYDLAASLGVSREALLRRLWALDRGL